MIRHPDCPVCKMTAHVKGQIQRQCASCTEMMIEELARAVMTLDARVKALEALALLPEAVEVKA